MKSLNSSEQAVLNIIQQNAQDVSGGDFAILEELMPPAGMSSHQFGGYITQLNKAGIIGIDEYKTNEMTTVGHQITIFTEA